MRSHISGLLGAYIISDYTLNNPDTLTKYKTAAQISHRVLEAVTGMTILRENQEYNLTVSRLVH